jgi:tRNA (guanine-N7-)-methyltransferase
VTDGPGRFASNEASPPPTARPIRSFVRRFGRITRAQQQALDDDWTRFGIDFVPVRADLDAIFGRRAPRVLEIGFGNGEQLLASALADPARDHLGIEVHRPGIGHLLLGAARAGVSNLRVIAHDAVEVLDAMIADGSLDEVRILFPDPWPKARHHKRRLVQPAFVATLAAKLAPGGRLHLATDWAPYAVEMLAAIDGCAALENEAGPGCYAPRPAWRILSRFERRGLGLGHAVFDLAARKRG